MVYATVIIVLSTVLAAYLAYHYTRRLPRNAAVRASGDASDLSYSEKDNSILERLKFFRIYDATTLQVAANNVLRSKTRPPDIWIFDYSAVIGLRKDSGRVEQTVFYFNDPRMKLPGFRILPKKSEIARRSDTVFKYRPIIFQANPRFMAHYRLIGPDEHDIRELFKPDLLGYFEKLSGLCVEGFGNEVIMYRHKALINEKQFPRFYRNARSIFELLLQWSVDKTGLTV